MTVDLEVPVLIVGGGGSGLTASMLLSHLGVESLLVSRYPETSRIPKAHVLNQRSMEIFSDIGVAPAILERSAPPENLQGVAWYSGLSGDGPGDGYAQRLAFIEGWGGGYTDPVNTYTLSFDLSGYNVSTASLSGEFAADNFGTVELNGHLLTSLSDTLYENFEQLHPFTASAADFVAGVNTLTFTITDTGPPSAFMVANLAGTADILGCVPEPATWAMFLAGFFGLGVMARARKGSVASA